MSTDARLVSPRPRGRPRIADAETLAIAATTELLESFEVRSITMELIAERSGVAKITLYRRWPSKLALFVDAMLARMSATMPLREDMSPQAAVQAHIAAMIRALRGPTGVLVRAVIGECLADRDLADILRERYLGHRREIAIRIIQRGLDEGSFGAAEPAEILHDALYGAIWYRFLFGVGRLDRRAAMTLLTDILKPVSALAGAPR